MKLSALPAACICLEEIKRTSPVVRVTDREEQCTDNSAISTHDMRSGMTGDQISQGDR